MSTFAGISAVTPRTGTGFHADLHPDWTVAGKPNGGYLLAVIGRAAGEVFGPDLPHVLAASAHYLTAADPGPVDIEIEVLRRGRRTGQARGRVVQGGTVRVEALLTTGRLDPDARPVFTDRHRPELPAREQCVRMPAAAPDGTPTPLLGHVDERLDPAGLGFATGRPGGRNRLSGWLSLPEEEPFDPVSLLFAVDAFPPATLDLGSRGWVPTLELTAYVRAVPAPGPVCVLQSASLIDDDRVDETCLVWDSRSRLVAQATQLAAVRMA